MNSVVPEGRLLNAVEAIYDAATDPSKWPSALEAIAACFDDAGALLLWRRDDNSYASMVSDGLVQAQREYEQGWASRDLLAVRGTERGYFFNGEPFTTRVLVTEDEMNNDPFFVQFRARHGIGRVGCMAVSPDPHIGVIISVQRHLGRPEHSEKELEVLGQIGRHIEKSLRLSIRLLDAELASLSLGDALARIGVGVFALDSLSRVLFSNRAGQRLLGDQLQLVRNQLRIGGGAEREAIEEAIERILYGNARDLMASPRPILIRSPTSDRRLVVYVLPASPRPTAAEQFLTQMRIIVLAIEQRFGEPPDPAVVRDILGLTLGEARIAALVGSGMPPKEAAQRLGIAEDTARNLLKRVFAKAGISRQSELTALLTKLVLR